MIVFCGRENERAIFTRKRDGDFPLEFLTSMDACKKEVVFAISGKTMTLTLPATIVQEMYTMGRLKFEK